MFRTKRSLLVRRLWRNRVPGGGGVLQEEEEEEAAAVAAVATRRGGVGGEPGSVAAAEAFEEEARLAHICCGNRRGCCCPGKTSRAPRGSAGAEGELKALTHAVLKRLKEKQLEGLLHAVESRGGARSPLFRWPALRHCSQVKRLWCCESYGKAHPELVCCNPHHLSRLCELADCPDSVPSSTETGGTNCLAPAGLS
ncbi:SMAD7 protein, partial [Todus mexicanus]|nr:SMAD7 protein [Todus mexicanus]